MHQVVPIFINEMRLVNSSLEPNDVKYKDAILSFFNQAIVNYEKVQKPVLFFLQEFISAQKFEARYDL